MALLSRWLTLTILAIAVGVWAWIMVVLGLLIIFDWPGRFVVFQNPRHAVIAGAALAASGVFMFAVIASRLFPQANPRVTAMFEITPWLGLASVVLGGLV